MNTVLKEKIGDELDGLRDAGTYKRFNYLDSPQAAHVKMEGRGEVLILSSNNYLGLANEPDVVHAGIEGLQRYGAGTASVRFICGTFNVHRELEAAARALVGTEASLTFVACWNANEALTPTLDGTDWVISDELNHASIIDSMRLARRRGARPSTSTATWTELATAGRRAGRAEVHLDRRHLLHGRRPREAAGDPRPRAQARRHRDGGRLARDGVLGETGRGAAEHWGVLGEVDVITSTLGKALGGAAGGFVAVPEAVCDMLTQRSRPQLFSNALPPTVACSSLAPWRCSSSPSGSPSCGTTRHFREALAEAGFKPLEARRRSCRSSSATPRRRFDERHAARRGRLRDGLRLPGRAAGYGSHPRPDVRRARAASTSSGRSTPSGASRLTAQRFVNT